MRSVPGIVAGACVAALIACAAAPQASKSAAPRPQSAGTDVMAPSPRHDEITSLYLAIEQDMGAANLPAPAPSTCGECAGAADAAVSMGIQPLHATDHPSETCKPGASETCKDSCTLSDSICDNAGKICNIAKELGDHDAFANDKCTRGSDACKQSQQRCCTCL